MIEYIHKEYQLITRILSKAFLRPSEFPEVEIAGFFVRGATVPAVNTAMIQWTRYYALRTGEADWTTPGCGALPQGLDAPLRYWAMPFADKPRRPIGRYERWLRRRQMGGLLQRFARLFHTMEKQGWVGPPLPGILLVENEQNRDVFIMTDGHHRVGAAFALFGAECNIPVYTPESCVFDWKRTKRAGRGRFSDADTRRIWDHVWERVDGTGY